MRLLLLSLRYVNERPILNFDLTGKLTDYCNFNTPTLEIALPSGTIFLNKRDYIDKWKVYEDPQNPKCFFIVASYKLVNKKTAFNYLMNYAISKIEKTVSTLSSRVDNLQSLKQKLQKELVAA
jgi:hypothetical protein